MKITLSRQPHAGGHLRAGLPQRYLLAGVLALLAFLWLVPAVAQNPLSGEPEEEPSYYTPEEEPQLETAVELPPFPTDSDLLEMHLDISRTQFRYYVDETSLRVNKDGIVLYAVVIKSKSGASNVFFEGIRCNEATYRSYAFGGSDGKWQPSRLRP